MRLKFFYCLHWKEEFKSLSVKETIRYNKDSIRNMMFKIWLCLVNFSWFIVTATFWYRNGKYLCVFRWCKATTPTFAKVLFTLVTFYIRRLVFLFFIFTIYTDLVHKQSNVNFLIETIKETYYLWCSGIHVMSERSCGDSKAIKMSASATVFYKHQEINCMMLFWHHKAPLVFWLENACSVSYCFISSIEYDIWH